MPLFTNQIKQQFTFLNPWMVRVGWCRVTATLLEGSSACHSQPRSLIHVTCQASKATAGITPMLSTPQNHIWKLASWAPLYRCED